MNIIFLNPIIIALCNSLANCWIGIEIGIDLIPLPEYFYLKIYKL